MSEFHIPFNGNKKLEVVISKVIKDVELNTLLRMSNVTAIDRLGFNDHGPTHVKIVSNSSLRMLRILVKHGVVPSIVKNYSLQNEDAEIVVVLASILHDIGHAIHRRRHELLSTLIAPPIIGRLLDNLYAKDTETIIKFETLHAIYCHESNIQPLTIEAGVMKIADALDMEKGRARIPYKTGSINIHSLSAMSIEKVDILEGTKRPLKVIVHMSNPAGIFQVDELLQDKVQTSGIKEMLTVEARLMKDGKEEVIKDFQF